MPRSRRPSLLAAALVLAAALLPAAAFQPRTPVALDALVIEAGPPPATAARAVAELPQDDALRAGWNCFSTANGGWATWIDARTGLPLLSRGGGIAWVPAANAAFPADDPLSLDRLEQLARAFLVQHGPLLGRWDGQLELDRVASGPVDEGRVWLVIFRQVVGGVPVDGARYEFQVSRGNLVAFGAARLAPVTRSVAPRVDVGAARAALDAYLAAGGTGLLAEAQPATLHLVPVDPRGPVRDAWTGARGAGLAHRLAWRFVLRAAGEAPTWVADVDADTGRVVAFHDDTKYERVQGGVFPVSNDGACPTGCEQAAFPLPFADVTQNGSALPASNDAGMYGCTTTGATIRTTLAGPYIRVHDTCGAVAETTTCDDPLDLGQGPGTDCVVPAGHSVGDTHSARSSFYHLNRVMQKGRAWLPDNAWLRSQVTDNVNLNSTCNAFWDGGSVNFYKSGGGCRNTGEIAGVFVHEWGHGLDNNDGGGYDNPSEAYADIVAFFETRESCVGRGFFMSGNCSGYGDACLDCTGIRDQDWNMHASHTPVTAAWVQANCGGGGGPCGGEVHCEGYLVAEVLWDLATRDLPAAGLDPATAWQTAEKLFYLSRKGSGGNAYNCSGSTSDGCGAGSWFQKILLSDDDDGNLGNGTPHAAAIFAAFKRHGIACGSASDPANQNSTTCGTLAKPQVAATPGSNSVTLNWNPVPGAAKYRILRNDLGCERAQIIIDNAAAPGTSYVDDGLPNSFTFYYRVQAVNGACESPVSECVSTAGQPFAGRVRFDAPAYGCAGSISLSVKDGNVAGASLTVTVASDSETQPETVVLTETPPNSDVFVGAIGTTTGAATHGDGLLRLADGDTITALYRDADSGLGQPATSWAAAPADCALPAIGGVQISGVTDGSAVVSWTTSEPTTGRVEWGMTAALGNATSDSQLATSHAVTIQPFVECANVQFRVFSTDAYGNTSTLDVGGAPWKLTAQKIPGALWRDDFETSSGWTLEGEWQIGAPQAKGTPGDPSVAFADAKVLGHDLSGLGAHPGDYEPHATERAISPVINASTLANGQLKFRRWLNTGGGGIASIEVKQGSKWTPVWTSDSVQGVAESGWSLQTVDLSPYANGNSALQFAFKQFGGPGSSGNRSGWNLDRVILRNGAQPDFAVCAACGAAPAFGGARAATDLDACADTGVSVAWDAAAGWGTGTAGTYAVYRDTTPNFTPGPANRRAAGLTGTSWTDTGAPNDATSYYLVRAENNETCGGGPANGGVVDANAVYAAVRPTTSRPAAAAVGDLGARLVNLATVNLAWAPAAGASGYSVYRSTSPATGYQQLAAQGATRFDDAGAGADGVSYFYSVRTVDACGRETP